MSSDSSTVICELLFLAFNAILFQRGLYARTEFTRARKWELPVMITCNAAVEDYIKTIIVQIRDLWLCSPAASTLSDITLIILDASDKAVERWEFRLQPIESPLSEAGSSQKRDLQCLMRQIGSTVAFLPILKGRHTFRVAVSEMSTELATCPQDWYEAGYREVAKAEEGEFHTVVLNGLVVQLKVLRTC